jgi:membrane associated rhomboid family serine protease
MTQPVFDYAPPLPTDSRPWRTVTRWLLVINVAIFVIDLALGWAGYARVMTRSNGEIILHAVDSAHVAAVGQLPFNSFAYFSVDKAIVGGQVWRFFTYQFVHANIEHVALNMLGLLLAGPVVEQRLGRSRFLLFYLLCGAAGPAAHIALSMLGVTMLNVYTPLVGASASIYGTLIAAAAIAPDEIVELALPPIDLKLRTFALLMVALSLFAVSWRWQNAGGHAAHLGGALAAWFLSRKLRPPLTGPT